MCRAAFTDDLGGHADVTGSSTVIPHRSSSSSQALCMRMRSSPTTTAEYGSGEENATGDGDLMNCLLRVAGTSVGGGGGADHGGLALRRKRRSNATDLDVGIRERISSPVYFGVVGDLGQRTARRRRSLPTPRLTVRDVAESGCMARPLRGTDEATQSTVCSGLQTFSDTAADSTTVSVREDMCLSDIDENISLTTSSTSAAPDVSLTTNNSTTVSAVDSDKIAVADNSGVDNIDITENNEALVSTTDKQKSVENSFTSTRVKDSENVDAVQHNISNLTAGSSTDSALRQSRSTADVDVTETWSSKWLPRRSQSLRLYRLRDHSAARGELESQQLDTNVHEFQTRAAPEREALRNRLRKLSLIYAASTDSDETSRTWPASRRPCADGEEGLATPTTVPGVPLRRGQDVISASSSTSTLQLKYDTDSLSSQKDEGFETASISSDVYLSSSQRSSMCDCDAAPTTMSTLERRTEPTVTKTTDGPTALQPETLPPPPASFLNGSETVDGDTPCCSGENSVSRSSESLVLPRGEVESSQQRPSSNVSVVGTILVDEKKINDANTESSGNGSPSSAKNTGSVRQKAQTVGTRQTKIAARPAPATPSRGSSLTASSTSRNLGMTRTAAAATSNHATGRASIAVKPTARPPSDAAATTSTSGRQVAFQRSSSQRVTDIRKLTPCSRAAPQPSSSAAFVRQSQTRTTIAAPVLRTNKRAAAEARKMKAAITSTNTTSTSVTQTSNSPSSRITTTTTSTSSNVVPRPQRGRCRTSSSGSCSSTTSASAGPKLTSFRAVSSATTMMSRQPAASVNVPSASSKKPNRGAVSSSSSSTTSNLRSSTQPPNSRLRAPVVTKKQSK